MQIISAGRIGIALIQEPYLYQNRLQGISKQYRTFTYGEGKSRAAIVIPDNTIDALLITQVSDNDAVLLEIVDKNTHFYAASIYLDYNEPMENNIKTLEKIVKFTKGAKILIGMDSNSRSTTWHDVRTNTRGKLLEEFLSNSQLHIINEGSMRTTFQSSKGASNIDLTIANNQMLAAVQDWEISEEESCSDHNIINFSLQFNSNKAQTYNFLGSRYIIKEQQHADFQKNLLQQILKKLKIDIDDGNTKGIDDKLNTRVLDHTDIDAFIVVFDEIIQVACKNTFTYLNSASITVRGTSVPWWKDSLTIMRKRTNAQRRYQRTINNEELRESRREYIEGKRRYQAALRKEKIISWINTVTPHHRTTHGTRPTSWPQGKHEKQQR
jgi:hypothetical protein